MSKEAILAKPNPCWANQPQEPEGNIAVSSRIRLARNLTKRPFPHLLQGEAAKDIAEEIAKGFASKFGDEDFIPLDLAELQVVNRKILFEKHFVSLDLLKNLIGRQVIINNQQSLAIMINEEDHLRMQCILPGLQLDEAWGEIDVLDDQLEENLDFAFDTRLGYLTACPTNLGTGLRASVMLHLPALVMANKLEAILAQLPSIGLTVRGVYGEGSESYGHLYQISNQISLGFSEEEILQRLKNVVEEIIIQERLARKWLWQNSRATLEDYIYRSYGILANARLISNKEVMEQISVMRLGVDLGIIKAMDSSKLNEMMISCQPAFLNLNGGKELKPAELDWARAKVVRGYFGQA